MSIQVETFVDLGVTKNEAYQMINVLKPKETQNTINSLHFVQMAKDLQKETKINLLDYDNVNWKQFSFYAKQVQSGVVKLKSIKLKEYVLYFAKMTGNAMRNAVRKIYGAAQKVYSTVAKSVTQFVTYLTSTKVVSSTIAMHNLQSASRAFAHVDRKIQTLYDECYWSYQTNILSHLKKNRILDIEAYHIDHILAQLSDLSHLVEEAKKSHYKLLQDLQDKKQQLNQEKRNIIKKYDDEISSKQSRRNWSSGLALLGVCGLFVATGPLAIAAAVAAAGGGIIAGVSQKSINDNTTEKSKELRDINEKITKHQGVIDHWKSLCIIGQLNKLATSIKVFHKQMMDVKLQYETKKNLKECDGDVALWLAKKNEHHNNNEKVGVYRAYLEELGVDNYNTFISISEEDIQDVFVELKSKYKTGILRQIRNVIKKYCSDESYTKVNIQSFKGNKH